MAEVFTPLWICNKQNNLVDNVYFGREGVFNTEVDNHDGTHTWIVNSDTIVFPEGKTWRDYVKENRLEITCGEAPYLVSRYDTVTGEPIPVERRIGLLDRKLRIVSENCHASGEWLKAAQEAFQSTYGYEWQGDNLVLAREALLYTFIDYYRAKFGKDPLLKSLQYIAYIISWNIWQIDGLKGVIPNSCGERRIVVADLFGETETITQCQGCNNGDIRAHNGTYALIYKRFDRIDEVIAAFLAVLLRLFHAGLAAVTLVAAPYGKHLAAVFTFTLGSHTRIFLWFYIQIRVFPPPVNRSQLLTTTVNSAIRNDGFRVLLSVTVNDSQPSLTDVNYPL